MKDVSVLQLSEPERGGLYDLAEAEGTRLNP